MTDNIPFIAVGNNELGDSLGKRAKCARCGKKHLIEYGERVLENGKRIPSKQAAFVKCKKTLFLVGINGRKIHP